MSIAFTFPGQGAQTVGMGADFFSSNLCQIANETVGFDLLGAMKDGPAETLQRTVVCQPALFLHSALVLEALTSNGKAPTADWYLGLSLGEYTALYAAGVLSFADAMRALKVRGQSMQEACDRTSGTMVSVLGLEDDQVVQICDQERGDGILQAANFNCPGQVVVSGDVITVERAIAAFKAAGAKRALPLKVAGAYHSPLMESAKEPLRNCLEKISLGGDATKVISNVTGLPHKNDTVVDALVEQITSPVRWTQSIQWLVQEKGLDRMLELGTGNALCGMCKRISTSINSTAVSTAEQLKDFF